MHEISQAFLAAPERVPTLGPGLVEIAPLAFLPAAIPEAGRGAAG